jgi:hypothetical protein
MRTTKPSKPTIQIELTAEQQEQVEQAVSKEVPALELLAEELEERVAPRLRIMSPTD